MTTRDIGRRPTKVVCTVGPASAERVAELIEAGMDIARVNWSHGTPTSRDAAVRAVRAAAQAAGRPIAVLGDLPGPKIRLGQLAGDEVTLRTGDRFELRPGHRAPGGQAPGDARGAGVTYTHLADDVRPGDRVFLADGAVELIVRAAGASVETEILRGGVIRSRQGVSIPSDRLSTPAVTDEDRLALEGMLAARVDLIGQSFVRSATDIQELRELLGADGPPIVAKIETRAAVDGFDAILEVVDAVMIARGDLGVELPFEDVPLIQKDLVRRAADRAVPSIVATQMLESMTSAPRPTRAEASDVANAVLDGADAVMLSGETAIGAYPVLAAAAAARIAERAAGHESVREPASAASAVPSVADAATGGSDDRVAMAAAAVALARAGSGIAAVVCLSRTGRTTRLLARARPGVPIVAVTADARTWAALALVHGVMPMHTPGLPQGAGDLPEAQVAELLAGAGVPWPPGSGVVLLSRASEAAGTTVAGHRLGLRRRPT